VAEQVVSAALVLETRNSFFLLKRANALLTRDSALTLPSAFAHCAHWHSLANPTATRATPALLLDLAGLPRKLALWQVGAALAVLSTAGEIVVIRGSHLVEVADFIGTAGFELDLIGVLVEAVAHGGGERGGAVH